MTLTNVGGAALGIDSIVTDDGTFSQSNTCGSSVEAGQSCAILVTFHPVINVFPFHDLKVTDNAADSPQFVGLGATASCVP